MPFDEIYPDPTAHNIDITPEAHLPLYQCDKQVRAVKIGRIVSIDKVTGQVEFEPADDRLGIDLIVTRPGWLMRFKPDTEGTDLGYWVQYKDGFSSWSPTLAFEGGYRRL